MSALPITQLYPLNTELPKAINICANTTCVPFVAYRPILVQPAGST